MISKQTIAITSRPRVAGGRKDTRRGRNMREKVKVFLSPVQNLDEYTCVCVSLAPRQGSCHCFCQPQQEPFKQETDGITPISPVYSHLCLKRKYLPPPPPTSVSHPLTFRLNQQLQSLDQATSFRNGSATKAVRTAKVSRDLAWKWK